MNRSSKVYTTSELRHMILPLLEKYDMASASLFGSYAREEADENSDIDVLLVGNPGFRLFNVCGVAEELYQASGKDVDVCGISEPDPGAFHNRVL